MVKLEKYESRFFDALSYQLDEEQSNFTASVDYCLNTRKDLEDHQKTLITITYNDNPVGFFILDVGNDRYRITENTNSVLIRSLSINPEYQGKGIGKDAMNLVSEYVTNHFYGVDELVLAVNFKNENAYHVYVKCGFIDDGKIVD
ncbi:MAG: GNAT family N-acetyltransferase [Bacteroidales bacterium]|nr:GNAT family N-acetyltransferase [Bacteroidales bacterium]